MQLPDATLLVLNPNSRNGDGQIGGVLDRLRVLGPLISVDSNGVEETHALLRRYHDDAARIVIGGGDGTVRSVLDLVLELDLPIGVLPLGTANDFAASLGLPDDPEHAAQVIVDGNIRRVDVGRANGNFFLNAVGIGLGPEMTKRLDADIKARLGVVAYAARVAEALRENRATVATVRCNGDTEQLKARHITIANGIHYGGGMTVTKDARLDDGQLDVLSIRPQGLVDLLVNGPALRRGEESGVEGERRFRAESVRIETPHRMDVTVDGDLLTKTPVECDVLPGALQVYAPQLEDPQ